jgi:hypothetical protein
MKYKYPKMEHMQIGNGFDDDDIVEITEKVDGANFSFFLSDDNQLIFRSRNTVIDRSKKHNFDSAIKYILDNAKFLQFNKNFIYFGECMTPHTLDYGCPVPFIGFGIADIRDGLFRSEWKYLYNQLGIDSTVDVIAKIPAKDITVDLIEDITSRQSAHATTDVIMEGIVLKSYIPQKMFKYVRPKFKEENRNAFYGSDNKFKDEMKIVEGFVTDARIIKCIHKTVDEGIVDKYDMSMMKMLPAMVNKDMWDECAYDIIKKYNSINNKTIMSITSKKCVDVLKRFLLERVIDG